MLFFFASLPVTSGLRCSSEFCLSAGAADSVLKLNLLVETLSTSLVVAFELNTRTILPSFVELDASVTVKMLLDVLLTFIGRATFDLLL